MRKKLRFFILSLCLTIVLKILMNIAGYSKWVLFGTRQNRFATSLIYFLIFLIGLALHLSFHKGPEKLKSVAFVALLPCSFFFSCCIQVTRSIMMIGLAMFSYLFYLDVKEIQFRRFIKPSLRGKKTVKLVLHCAEKNILHLTAYVGITSFLVFATAGIRISLDDFHYNDYGTRKTDWSEEHPNITYANNKSYLYSAELGNLWDGNRELLKELSSKNYPKKSMDERLQAWQGLLELECVYLGTPTVPTLGTEVIETKGKNGYYNAENNVIVINQSLLEDDQGQKKVLKTLLHEAFHHYSYCSTQEIDKLLSAGVNMNLMFARDLVDWNYEQTHYYSYDPDNDELSDYDRYRSQKLEESANSYADEWYLAYWQYIEKIE